MTHQANTDAQLARIAVAFYETIANAGIEGCPTGPMYAAVMGLVSYEVFQFLLQTLVRADAIVIRNHVAFAVTDPDHAPKPVREPVIVIVDGVRVA